MDSGGDTRGRAARTSLAVVVAVCLAGILTLGVVYVRSFGDAPQTPSHDSWLDQAHTALDEVSSDVATVQLLLRLVGEGKVPSRYQRIAVLDSESAAGKVSDHLSGEQPSRADQATYSDVVGVLSDASDLLTSVRVALVREDSSQYQRLSKALGQMQTKITKAEAEVPS
jgi:hypothetical protein